MRLTWRLFVREPPHRIAKVWHALSRDHTVLLAIHAFIHEWNKPYSPLPSQPKLVLIYGPRRDERLSWYRHHLANTMRKQSAQDRYVTEITVVSCSNRHASLGNWSAWAMSVELMTWRIAIHNSNHWAAESPTVGCSGPLSNTACLESPKLSTPNRTSIRSAVFMHGAAARQRDWQNTGSSIALVRRMYIHTGTRRFNTNNNTPNQRRD